MSILHGKTESLSVCLPWERLLGHLGVKLDSAALPMTVECPMCGNNSLQVIPDHLGGEWFSCVGCDKAGDAIQLAAWVWEIAIPDAIKKLSREGFEIPTDGESIRSYHDRFVKHRERMNALWKHSQRNHLHNSTPLRRLVHELRFHSEAPDSRWKRGPGQLIGSTNQAAVLATYYPKTKATGRNKSGNLKKFFPGRNWGDVLALPYHDLPGRISGFHFIGKAGKVEDQLFRGVNYPRDEHRHIKREAGLYFHPEAFQVSEQHWDNIVFAIRNPVMALQLHARHFETSTLALPLLSWQEINKSKSQEFHASDADTEHAWRMTARHKVVFWMPKLDAAVLKQASIVGGLISMIGPDKCSKDAIQDYVWKRAPVDLLKYLARTARPWVEIFASAVTELSDSLVEQLVLKLVKDGTDLAHLINQLPDAPRDRLRTLMDRTGFNLTTNFNYDKVTEKDGKWVVRRHRAREETVLNGILRVDHVIYHARTKASYLEGRLIAGDVVIPFCESEAVIKRDPLKWLSELARDKGQTLVEGRRSWNKKFLEVAYSFHTPKYVAGVDVVGWDTRSTRFILPKFNIHLGGRVEPALTDLLSVNVPGLNLTRPVKLSDEDFASVSKDDDVTRTFWSCLLPLLANIIAPAFARNPSGIITVGTAAHKVGFALGLAMGCQRVEIRRGCLASEIDRLQKLEFVHGWPLLAGGNRGELGGKWWGCWTNDYSRGYRNCMVAFDAVTGMVRATQPGWHVVVAGQEFPVPAPWKPLAAKLVPAYLRDLATRNFKLQLEESTDTWLGDVLQDMAGFVDRAGADPASVLSSCERLWPDKEYGHARAFAHLLGLLIRSGHCLVEPEGFPRKDRLHLLRGPAGLFIPEEPLRRLLFDKHHLLPDHEVITKALTLDEVLVEDREEGWVIDEQWWRASQQTSARLRP